jgi:hypothetical protein
MTACGRTHQLEAVVVGEAPAALAAELRAHARRCARCRHELDWLETEAALFRQRAGREEVAHLWAGVAERRGLEAPRPWGRMLTALAAAVVLSFAGGRLAGQARPGWALDAGVHHEALETDALMSPALELEANAACSTLPTGVGFHCSAPVLASR